MSTLDDLDQAARSASTGERRSAVAALSALSWMQRSIASDRADELFSRWGLSTVVDENTGSAVLPRGMFEELHALAGIPCAWPVGNAGLLHTYGYLLSLTETPYGLKRERWLGSTLATACGLAPDAFLPWHEGPTLLARATAAASALLALPALERCRMTDGRVTRVALSRAEGPGALAYAVAEATGGAPLLVTLFPVSAATDILAEFDAAEGLRWNAV